MEPDEFKKKIEDVLQRHGHKFQGIRLRCRKCGEQAFAVTPEFAQIIGWSDLTKCDGPLYEGICIDCGYPDSPQPEPKGK